MQHPERKTGFWPFLLLALLLHYVELTLLPSFSMWRPTEPPQESFDLEFLPSEPASELAEKQKKQKEKADRTPDGQVVELPKPDVEEIPDHARFVSEYDIKVTRETRAKQRFGAREPLAAPPPTSSVLAMRERSQPSSPAPALPTDADGSERSVATSPSEGPPSPDARPQGPSLDQLRPNSEQLTRAIGSGAGDYLPDTDEGDETALNSRRWRFASFYNRVKQQVAENWHPEIAYRRRDPYGNVYGYRDRITVLRVSLWPDGSLKDLLLDRPSGVEFLDDEAVQAFRAAQPFMNPPRQLVDPENGLISFRFGFVFEINSTPTFRVFRYND